jgi:glycosyltransferase involved in cell wall biosynthesis
MRILLVNDKVPPEAAGAGKAVWALATGLTELDHDIYVVSASHVTGRERRHGVEMGWVRASIPERWRGYLSLYNPQAVRQFRRYLDEVSPHVVHVHNVHGALSYGCILAASRAGYPVAYTAHDVMSFSYTKLDHYLNPLECPPPGAETYRLPTSHNLRVARFRYNPLRNTMIRAILRRHVQARTAVSDALRVALEANGLGPHTVVHPGVALDAGGSDPEMQRVLAERLGIAGRPTILLAGRISRAKGVIQALSAFAKVKRWVPNAILLVLSDRPVDTSGCRPGLSEDVIQAGWLVGSELSAAFQLADVVVCPSICLDSFSLVALEAMSARRPVVASCHGGFAESVLDGVSGYIINPFDIDVFARKLVGLLTDPDARARFGVEGYRRYQGQFTPRHYAQRMIPVYSELVG